MELIAALIKVWRQELKLKLLFQALENFEHYYNYNIFINL